MADFVQHLFHLLDLFVTLSGVGMAFAYRNRVSHWVSLRRVVVLLVVGLIFVFLFLGGIAAIAAFAN